MNYAWKYEIISRVEQDISLVRFAHLLDILVNTRNKFHISAHPMYYSLLNLFHTFPFGVNKATFREAVEHITLKIIFGIYIRCQ